MAKGSRELRQGGVLRVSAGGQSREEENGGLEREKDKNKIAWKGVLLG